MNKFKRTLLAWGFSAYCLFGLSGNSFAEESKVKREYPSAQNLVTDYRPVFEIKLFPCLYPPKTEEQKLEQILTEENAKENLKLDQIFDRTTITTYPLLKLTF